MVQRLTRRLAIGGAVALALAEIGRARASHRRCERVVHSCTGPQGCAAVRCGHYCDFGTYAACDICLACFP